MTRQEAATVLTNAGLRPTHQRLSVYLYLLEHPIHPSADTVYAALLPDSPSFSRTTIYNSLYALEKAGLIRRLNIDKDEQRFDADTADHGHFRCRSCGEIFDFPLGETGLRACCPPDFQAESCDLFFVGLCPDCAAQS